MNIKNKTGRKNKTNLIITWPSASFFTIKDMFTTNPHFVPITMRVRVKSELEQGKLKDIGVIHNGKGRPTNVYTLAPVTADTIAKAKDAMVILHTEYLSTKVADIKTPTATTQPTSTQTHITTKTTTPVAV
jgi:hypothetical protein